ncbi:MAG: hypothetical protein KBE65_22505 [Phycisphaerae bacterium]|nr:hypothetical protein [Phycisphaerae bacterium]
MDKRAVKFALAAVVVAAVVLGLFEFAGTGGSSGVVWADVARKIDTNRGFTFQQRVMIDKSGRSEQVACATVYNAGSRLRQNWRRQPEGELVKSCHYDFDAKTCTYVSHEERTYLVAPMEDRTVQSQENGCLNPKNWVHQFLSSKYAKLGHQTIEGVPCEGIETSDPAFAGGDPPPAHCVAQLWVSVETGYPVRLEYSSVGRTTRGDEVRLEVLCDRFQWDVELSPDFFEPNIPPDYRQLPDSQ